MITYTDDPWSTVPSARKRLMSCGCAECLKLMSHDRDPTGLWDLDSRVLNGVGFISARCWEAHLTLASLAQAAEVAASSHFTLAQWGLYGTTVAYRCCVTFCDVHEDIHSPTHDHLSSPVCHCSNEPTRYPAPSEMPPTSAACEQPLASPGSWVGSASCFQTLGSTSNHSTCGIAAASHIRVSSRYRFGSMSCLSTCA